MPSEAQPARDFLRILSGFPFASSLFGATGFPLIRIRDLLAGTTETFYIGNPPAEYVVRKGDILIGMDGDFNAVRWRGGDALLNQRVLKIAGDNKYLDTNYLFHWLQPKLDQIHRITPQTTVKHLSVRDLQALTLPLPPLPEQRRIAEVLDTLDTVIERTEQIIAKLKAARTGLLHDLLTRGLDEQGQLRDPELHPEQFKDTELGRVPEEWRLMSVAETAAPTPGSTVIGPFGSNLVAADYRDAGTPVVFVRDIKEDGFTWKSDVYVDVRKAKELRAHSIQPGDVVVTKMGDPPCLACVYPNWMPPSVMTADIIRVSVDLQSVDARWLALYINSGEVKRQVRWITGGVTRSKVTLKDFRQLTVAVPTLAEQHRILDVVSGTMHKTQAEQTHLAKFQALKRGLMEDLLTGRVRVPVSEGVAS